MAVYGALVSVMHIIDQIQHHPHPPISLDQTQVESLTQNLNFLQEFLQGKNSHVADMKALESRIADAAYAVEDTIESHIVDQILSRSTGLEEMISLIDSKVYQLEEYNTRGPHMAYASLISLTNIIEQVQCNLLSEISLEKCEVESFNNKVDLLQDFLERYPRGGSNNLEIVADVAFAAKDMINRFIAVSTSPGEEIETVKFYQSLQKVMQDMELVKKEVMEIQEKMGVRDQTAIDSSRSSSTGRQDITMVGSKDVLLNVMDMLTRGEPGRRVIPIVGMGGIGKSTLARNVYQNQVVVQHFDILAWVTISHKYDNREILLQLLCPENTKDKKNRKKLSKMNENELGEELHKTLFGRRYLIVMDDVWDVVVWDQLKMFLPDNSNNSRVMLTTRLSNLAFNVAGFHGLKLGFLDADNSWNLFCKIVFGGENFPPQFEEIGKKIVDNCRGLPLSITVIGGLLAKSEKTQEYWEHIAENLNPIVNLQDDEYCLQILYTSYNSLPVWLKPCFLYMGVFPENRGIRVTELIELWAAEGFLKQTCGKNLEEIAQVYLEELIDRNLVLVAECNSYGKIKLCKIHDLLRDLCLREAEKEKFFCVISEQDLSIPHGVNTGRRIYIRKRRPKEGYLPQVLNALESSASLARSLIWEYKEPLPSFDFRLLRVCPMVIKLPFFEEKEGYADSIENLFEQVNWRFLSVDVDGNPFFRIPSSVSLLWNLQTFVVNGASEPIFAASEIWKMPLLRHVKVSTLQLQDPPIDDIVLEHLQTLSVVNNFKCDEDVVKRIPNIKKLKLHYEKFKKGSSIYCLNNLGRLQNLESLHLSFRHPKRMQSLLVDITFPHSLKKLTLEDTNLDWEVMTTMLGSLPLLEVLKLREESCNGPHWETVEGQFCSLTFLLIEGCNIECWTTESDHFPRLKYLSLEDLPILKEIPSSVGDIPTLELIKLKYCNKSLGISAKRIQKEQEELGNCDLKVHSFKENEVEEDEDEDEDDDESENEDESDEDEEW